MVVMNRPPRFIADEMNGDIARWLRIIGFDCKYLIGKEMDTKLIEIALDEDRVLLTSDKELFRKATLKGVETHYIPQGKLEDKLRSIIEKYNLNRYIDKVGYRCPICNQPLIRAEDISQVPEKVRLSHKTILHCPRCNKFYWKGSHWKKIKKVLLNAGLTNENVKKL